jgi:hypothetical protein
VQFFPLLPLLPLLLPLLLLPKVLFSSFESIESIFVSKKSLVFISEVSGTRFFLLLSSFFFFRIQRNERVQFFPLLLPLPLLLLLLLKFCSILFRFLFKRSNVDKHFFLGGTKSEPYSRESLEKSKKKNFARSRRSK